MIAISLTDEQVESFRFCSENWEEIKKLREDGFFELKGGQYIVDKNSDGKIGKTSTISHHRWNVVK